LPQPQIGIGKRIVYVTIPVIVLLVLLEVGWRVYLASTGFGFFDPPEEFVSPFFTIYDEPRPLFNGDWLVYRNEAVARKKLPGEIRIVCLGGSTTVNYRAGVSYPRLLEERFARELGKDPPIRVLNAGGDGYSTAHVLVDLSLRNLDAQPDIITVFENINDLSAAWFPDPAVSDYANKYLTDFYLGMRHRTGLVGEIVKVSRLARYLVEQVDWLRFPRLEMDTDADYRPALGYYVRNLKSIVAVARAHGIRVLLASQPAGPACHTPAFDAFNAAARDLAEEEHVRFVDLAATVTDDDLFFDDCIHNNRDGVEKVAETLRAPLADLIAEVRAAKSR
jgi:lysophospholipase L1-like esterase